MPNEKKNMDMFLEERMKLSLHNRVSDGFTNNLMQQIELEQKFAIEDKKTDRMVTYIIGAFSAVLIAFAVILGISISGSNSQIANTSKSWFSELALYMELYTEKLFSVFGFSINPEYILLAAIIGVFVFLFAGADKLILKKRL